CTFHPRRPCWLCISTRSVVRAPSGPPSCPNLERILHLFYCHFEQRGFGISVRLRRVRAHGSFGPHNGGHIAPERV
ncbi:hypothetical protein MPH_10238, partial [Macrophomina phaseolina MS6]